MQGSGRTVAKKAPRLTDTRDARPLASETWPGCVFILPPEVLADVDRVADRIAYLE